MWSTVVPADIDTPAPSARSKHSATLIGDCVYLLGGRNGNLPLKDFWKYNLVTGKWQQLHPTGDKLPSLQEHTAIAYKDNIYVFGGEVGFSAGNETPLWNYDIKNNTWRKIRSKKGVNTPKGRRGHSALIHRGTMLIYGGYQDLRGSSSELWALHFETESWHLLSNSSPPKNGGNSDQFPPPRHKHSAILHDDAMWIYGGMTDLQERADLWKWDIVSKNWTNIRTKINPGPLHSHAACKLPSSMVIFGGERNGHPTNELWKFNFSMELWEKILINGPKPQPRSETIAFTVSEFMLNDHPASIEHKSVRIRARTCTSADRGSRHSSYLPHGNNKVAPYEKTYVFQPSQNNYTDGSSDLAQQYSEGTKNSKSFLQEISKLSQMNITRLNNKCNYTVLTGGCTTDSTESLLKQHASPPDHIENELDLELDTPTPSKSSMVKSKSAYVIKKYYQDSSPEELSSSEDTKEVPTNKKRVEFDCRTKKIPREPISVPNFSLLTLPTPVLTPVEATKLVYLDTDDENDLEIHETDNNVIQVSNKNTYENFKPSVKRGESYSSHLGYADNPLYQHMITTSSSTGGVKFQNSNLPEPSDENISSTSDYASIETMNRLSSSSNYSVKTNTLSQHDEKVTPGTKSNNQDGPFGFCNPNYLGPNIERKNIVNLLNHQHNPSSNDKEGLKPGSEDEEDLLEMQNYNGLINKNTKIYYKNHHSSRITRPPKFLALNSEDKQKIKESKNRALSASRVERNRTKMELSVDVDLVEKSFDPFVPLYVYIIGGKEHGQVTVFQRPISIWKLKLF